MSFKVWQRIMESPGCAQDSAWALLAGMAYRAHDDGTEVFEEMESLGPRCGLKPRTAYRARGTLLRSGLIEQTGWKPTKGRRKPVYRIRLDRIASCQNDRKISGTSCHPDTTSCQNDTTSCQNDTDFLTSSCQDDRNFSDNPQETKDIQEKASSEPVLEPVHNQSTQPVPALAGGVVESIDTPEEETVDAIGRIPVSPTAAEPPPQAPSAPPRWEMAAWAILDGKPVSDKVSPGAVQFARDRLNEARDLGVGRGRLALARKPPSSPLMEALRKDDPALYRAVHWAWNPRVEEGNGWYKEQGPLSKALARNLRQSLLDHCPESYGPGALPWWRPPGRPPLADGSFGNTPGVDCCPVCKANGGKDVQDSGTFRHIDCACRRGYAGARGGGGKAQASAPPKAQAPSARPAGPGKYNPQAGLVMKEAV
jgi:hypothetical protein